MYLSAIGINPYYFWFKEIVTSPDKGWDDKLYEIGTRFLEGNAKNIKDYDYVQHLFYSISESINRGELTEKHSKDTMFRQVADQTLSNMAGYLSRSQEYLGMSPKDIDDHRPVESLKNHYNNSLCSRI